MDDNSSNIRSDKWQILVKTRLFHGLDTSPIKESICLPHNTVLTIENIVVSTINYVLSHPDHIDCGYNNEGIHAIEIYSNQILSELIEGAKLRVDLYPASQGLCVVINIKYDKNHASKIKHNPLSIEDMR